MLLCLISMLFIMSVMQLPSSKELEPIPIREGITVFGYYSPVFLHFRLARGRDEWESATLQNANTRCNGLLPIWGPKVSDSAFASGLAK